MSESSDNERRSGSLPVINPAETGQRSEAVIALVGNPNAGKTTLFNALTGLRSKTANFPGTTVDFRQGSIRLGDNRYTLVDLPGTYSLQPSSPEEEVTARFVHDESCELIVVVVDATHLNRNLLLVSELLEQRIPVVVALNMMDEARQLGLEINVSSLQEDLKCPVVGICAKSGENLHQLKTVIQNQFLHGCESFVGQDVCGSCGGCQYAARFDWAENLTRKSVSGRTEHELSQRTRAIDRYVTHPVLGLLLFSLIGVVTFALIFWLAAYPMDWMESLFSVAGSWVGHWIPEGDLNSLITDGIIGGVGGMLVFLPQIVILFFLISLLEDSGYLARAAFVMDRLLQKVGLPGKAFVPMLAAHACAIPAIMSSRVIDDPRDRLKTILILPLMTCSARLPVYSMVVAVLFPASPLFAALVFAGCYSLGIVVAIVMAFLFKLTILPGKSRHLVIELPPYRFPSLRNAALTSLDRGIVFVRKAGTTILVFSVVLWILATYPKTSENQLTEAQQTTLNDFRLIDQRNQSDEASRYLAAIASENSAAGRLGRILQPVFAPLGFDWKITVGVLNSFAAREVVVSTLAILYQAEEEENDKLIDSIRKARDKQGNPVFTVPTCLSLLVFFVLAMQCLPTTAVVKRETGGWKWALFQIAYMTVLAYGSALITYRIAVLWQ